MAKEFFQLALDREFVMKPIWASKGMLCWSVRIVLNVDMEACGNISVTLVSRKNCCGRFSFDLFCHMDERYWDVGSPEALYPSVHFSL